jgi:hypothetical protein
LATSTSLATTNAGAGQELSAEAVLLKAVDLVGTSVKELRKLFCRD